MTKRVEGARPELGTTRLRGAEGPARSPYGKPVIKEPVWTPEIPAYFYVGGLAGASAPLALLSAWRGERGIAKRAWLTAAAGSVVSPVLLISDLGVPVRFLNMLRMFKLTSPMSVGSWILVGFGTATAPATLHALTDRKLLPRPLGDAAQVGSALLGIPLASYTAALIGNTSIPVWHEARHDLPFVFTAGAATSAGAMATMLSPVGEAQAARRLAVAGAAAELGLVALMKRRLKARGVAGAYHEGRARWYSHAGLALTAAGGAIVAARGARDRRAAIAGGALLSAGAVAERLAIFRAGFRSAARPQDTVAPQRRRIDAGQRPGAARTTPHQPAAPQPGGALDARRPGEREVTPGSPAIGPS